MTSFNLSIRKFVVLGTILTNKWQINICQRFSVHNSIKIFNHLHSFQQHNSHTASCQCISQTIIFHGSLYFKNILKPFKGQWTTSLLVSKSFTRGATVPWPKEYILWHDFKCKVKNTWNDTHGSPVAVLYKIYLCVMKEMSGQWWHVIIKLIYRTIRSHPKHRFDLFSVQTLFAVRQKLKNLVC